MYKKFKTKVEPFYCNNSEQYTSIKDLIFGLKNMNKDSFEHHVNKEKNDFATWIKKAVKDKKLSELIFDTKDKKQMQITIMEYVLNKI